MSDNQAEIANKNKLTAAVFGKDLISGTVVFLVALPLCLGIAVASSYVPSEDGATPINVLPVAGLIAGIVGGLIIGPLSGSQTSVSGPAAGLTAVVATQLGALGSFEAFLVAVMIGGVIQIGLGLVKAGGLNAFFPSSVIKGLLAAIGVILILKQIPHLFGHDDDAEGEMSFQQPDSQNTFSELYELLGNFHWGAVFVGLTSILILVLWQRIKPLKNSIVPSPLIVVIFGMLMVWTFRGMGTWEFVAGSKQLVEVPVASSLQSFVSKLFTFPDFGALANVQVYVAGFTIAIVASLETLLNLEAVDGIDPHRRHSPPNRELIAQGIGNITCGAIGGLPVTSVIVRSSVNISTGARTKVSAIFHGVLLLGCVGFFPQFLNMIPLSCLAAILIMTGLKLASPKLFVQMWKTGWNQFIPFATTVLVIVFTDLLVGILVGLAVSLTFILKSNLRRPMRKVVEKHASGEIIHIELANQVSFLNIAALDRAFREVPDGGHVLLDARGTDYIDPDVFTLIRDFKEEAGPARNVQVSLRGFREKYDLEDEILFVDYTSRELQQQLTPESALQVLMEGNERFRSGHRLSRDLGRQLRATSHGQHPMAVVLSCIDSRTPAEIIFDLGLGDVFSCRVAGNIVSPMILGSIEYGCAVAGAKLVMVLGHTRCGAVTAACSHAAKGESADSENVNSIIQDLKSCIDHSKCNVAMRGSKNEQNEYIDQVAADNVQRTVESILQQSPVIKRLTETGDVAVVGGMYDVATGKIDFFVENGLGDSDRIKSV